MATALNCGTRCAKSILISFNMLFWLSGCALLVLGGWALLEPAKEQLFRLATTELMRPDTIFLLAYTLLALGGSVLVIGVLGCFGALHEKRCIVVTYAVLLFLLEATELGVAFAALAYRSTVFAGIEGRLLNQLKTQYGSAGMSTASSPEALVLIQDFTTAMDYTQFRLNCCGINGDKDYESFQWQNQSSTALRQLRVPLTCCLLNTEDVEEPWRDPRPREEEKCQSDDLDINMVARFKKGCLPELTLWLQRESNVLIACTVSVAVLQLLGIFFSICLCRNIAEDV